MPNYSKSMIYQIWSPSNPELIYIGSTTEPTLSRRMAKHRSDYRRYLNGECNYISSFDVLACGDARIELIECVECKDRKELHAIEGKYIRERDCINKYVPGRSNKQYRQDNKQKKKEYDQQYRQKNKQKIKEYNRQRKYYQKNKQQINSKRTVKIVCECGSSIQKDGLSRHRKSKKHQQYIASQKGL